MYLLNTFAAEASTEASAFGSEGTPLKNRAKMRAKQADQHVL